MTGRSRGGARVTTAALFTLLLAGCAASPATPSAATPAAATPSATTAAQATSRPTVTPIATAPTLASSQPTTAAIPSPSASFNNLAACDFQPPPGAHPWLCGTLDVPLDRADSSAGTLPITYMVLPHSDTSTPAGVPFFATPGGPGASGFDNYALYAIQPALHEHHDIVTMDPRGTGDAGAIDCPAIQANPQSEQAIQAAVAACGQQLGTASSRYGAADRAADVEAVRQALGYDLIDYYGGSYGGVDVQAYAARFPDRLHAVILDSTFPVNDPEHLAWTQGSFGAPAQVHTVALRCQRDDLCTAISPDPEAAILKMIRTVRNQPVQGTPSTGASPAPITVDELAVAFMIATADPHQTVNAAVSLAQGDAQPLVDLAAEFPGIPPMSTEPLKWFSVGANVAGWCNDQDVAWDRTDPPATRRTKYAAYLDCASGRHVRAVLQGDLGPCSTSWTNALTGLRQRTSRR